MQYFWTSKGISPMSAESNMAVLHAGKVPHPGSLLVVLRSLQGFAGLD